MSADLQELAVRNRHTTTAEALEVARQIKESMDKLRSGVLMNSEA
jgi:ribonuclease BN (tRNA processing enzyme)